MNKNKNRFKTLTIYKNYLLFGQKFKLLRFMSIAIFLEYVVLDAVELGMIRSIRVNGSTCKPGCKWNYVKLFNINATRTVDVIFISNNITVPSECQ